MPKLTDLRIRGLKPAAKAYKVFDGRGLYLEVYPGGSKIWRLKYKWQGRETRKSLGPWPEITLAEARDETGKIRAGLRRGQRPENPRAKSTLFKDVAKEWFDKNYQPDIKRYNTIRHIKKIVNDLIKTLGSYKITEITSDLIIKKVLEPLINLLSTAKNTLSCLSNILDYAIILGEIEFNQAKKLVGYLPPIKREHVPSLKSPKELKEFLKRLNEYEINTHSTALKILIYVFVRPNELIKVEWDELDFEKKIWTIPNSRMKMNKSHIVPLSDQVANLFQSLPKINKMVFYNAKRNACMDKNCLVRIIDKLGYHGKASLHGFRATASTLLNQLGYNSDWIEHQLAHVSSGVRAVYNFADFLRERSRMMQDWADHVDRLAAD
jgi:integrase